VKIELTYPHIVRNKQFEEKIEKVVKKNIKQKEIIVFPTTEKFY